MYYQNQKINPFFYQNQQILYQQFELVKYYLEQMERGNFILIYNKIKTSYEWTNTFLFHEIKDNLSNLCMNHNGSLLIIFLLDYLSHENVIFFLYVISFKIQEIINNKQGTRVIQKLIEVIKDSDDLFRRFIEIIFTTNLEEVCISNNGHYVILKIFDFCKKYTGFIYNYIYNNYINIVCSKYGVSIIQKCFLEGDNNAKEEIINLTVKYFDLIINNEYGNFMISFIIINSKSIDEPKSLLKLIKTLNNNILDYYKKKIPASVYEKTFEKASKSIRAFMLDSLISDHGKDIPDIIINNNGSYIIQKILTTDQGKNQSKLYDIIFSDINKIKQNPIGIKILTKLKELACLPKKYLKYIF